MQYFQDEHKQQYHWLIVPKDPIFVLSNDMIIQSAAFSLHTGKFCLFQRINNLAQKCL
jgi:hypothetical protein